VSFLSHVRAMFGPGARLRPAECFLRIREGRALLVDVREPGEWAGGVAKGALLLPLSDLMGPRAQWRRALARSEGRELVLYCAAGGRAGRAAGVLVSEGFRAVNAGGFADWAASGWEVASRAGSGPPS